MKCPKCGTGIRHTIAGFYCNGCEVYLTPREIDDIKYQQRLDKVLSKFDYNEDSGYYWINLFSGIDITYNRFNKSEFHLWNVMEVGQMRNAYKKIKTINTVESLLEDLEK